MNKTVRFYTPRLVDKKDQLQDFKPDFWKEVKQAAEKLSADERVVQAGPARYFGEMGTGTAPALSFLNVGRIRTRAEFPKVIDENLDKTSLSVTELLEDSWIVPFGTGNTFAHMGPLQGLVPLSAVTAWLIHVLNLVPKGESLILAPEVDPNLAAKLAEAVGAKKIVAKIPAGAAVAWPPNHDSAIDNAVDAAVEAGGGELDATIELSHGRRSAGFSAAGLLSTLRGLRRSGSASKLQATLLLPNDGGGLRTEFVDFLHPNIAKSVSFEVTPDVELTTNDVLTQVAAAIKQFQETA